MKIYILPVSILLCIFFSKALFADRYDDANKCYLEAYNLYRYGKMDQSLELLKKVIEIDPDHAEAYFGMGSIYFRQNMYNDAVREFTMVTRIKPEYPQAYERLWLAYKKLGRNNEADEALQKYKKIMAERMQTLSGKPPQVVKPVSPLVQEKKTESKLPETTVETSQSSEIKSSGKTTPEKKLAESRPSETEEEEENNEVEEKENILSVVKPVTPQLKESVERSDKESKTSILETSPPGTKPTESSEQSSKVPSNSNPDKEYKYPQINVNKHSANYQNVFKPFKKIGSILFQNPFRKSSTNTDKSFTDKLLKWFICYIMTVQIWLCVVTSLFIYFRNRNHKKQISQEEFQSNRKGEKKDLVTL